MIFRNLLKCSLVNITAIGPVMIDPHLLMTLLMNQSPSLLTTESYIIFFHLKYIKAVTHEAVIKERVNKYNILSIGEQDERGIEFRRKTNQVLNKNIFYRYIYI